MRCSAHATAAAHMKSCSCGHLHKTGSENPATDWVGALELYCWLCKSRHLESLLFGGVSSGCPCSMCMCTHVWVGSCAHSRAYM